MNNNKIIQIIIFVFIVYGVLVASHNGEFWPFSIYPMFSQAGHPWTKFILRDVTYVEDTLLWKSAEFDKMIGTSIPLNMLGLNHTEFSNFVINTQNWNSEHISALKALIGEEYLEQKNGYYIKCMEDY